MTGRGGAPLIRRGKDLTAGAVPITYVAERERIV